ncbi:phage protease [Methylopila sp. 73B]|uniref:phage protease n=1 Tax=Methylopila sp. 73B TaxID=1120792 RepID=UPI00035E8D7D|nr:phage protease [Methylopila sp. 73B]
MSRPAASPDLSLPNVAAGVVVTDVAIAAAGAAAGTAPDWIKIGPRGSFTTRDGRAYAFDPDTLVARFSADGVDIPVDLDHAIVEKAAGAAAQGWVKQLEARADGLYGKVEWLAGGKAALAARTHRYVSPSFHHDAAGVATWIHSISLVPAPALPGAAVASAGHAQTHPETSMKGIAAALGLNADANEAACLSALTEIRSKTVDKAVHDEALASLSAAKTELDGIKAAARKKEVDDLLEGALKAKTIVPAERDAYANLCATDAGLASVRELLKVKPAQLGASGLDSRPAPAGGLAAPDVNPVTLAAKAQMYQSDMRAKGVEVSISDAVNAVSAEGAR